MKSTARWLGVVVAIMVIATGADRVTVAQNTGGSTSVAFGVGASRATAQALDARIDTMVAAGSLVLRSAEADPLGPGRVHEYFVQMHDGVVVYGGGVSRQRVGGQTISAFGSLYDGITVAARPRLSSNMAVAGTPDAPLAALVPDSDVMLVVLPLLDGGFRLTYRATYADGQVRFVDADNGAVVRSEDAYMTQSAVGLGTGVQGDAKKVSATLATTYEARDTLRPVSITTRSTLGTNVSIGALLAGAGATAVDADNVWTSPAVVDAHVNTGWTTDYFFKQHNWRGVDGQNSPVVQVVADRTTLPDNAFFQAPSSSASGTGLVAFGVSSRGVPMTPLDIVAHELMHGVTFFSVRRRTGLGLSSALLFDGLGPTSATFSGQSFSCATTVLNFGGTAAPFLCQNGQYVLVSSHGGALNEGFSDVFGTAAEFFIEPAGNAALRADYVMGEDTAIGGPAGAPDIVRSLINPASIGIVSGVSYPDHYDRRIRYAVVVLQGSSIVAPYTIINGQLIAVPTDGGGVHINATVIGHAYYLAIEGGTNRTSGRAVTGVGQANREQIERVFFRAMTVLTPQSTSFPIMASALRQAAVDLYGSSSAAFRAVDQALGAGGL